MPIYLKSEKCQVKMVKAIPEREFQQQVIDLAHIFHWRVYHTWMSIHSAGGFPDLTLARGNRLIFAETKSEKGRLTLAQAEWLEILKATGKCEVYVWMPSDWPEIVKILE